MLLKKTKQFFIKIKKAFSVFSSSEETHKKMIHKKREDILSDGHDEPFDSITIFSLKEIDLESNEIKN